MKTCNVVAVEGIGEGIPEMARLKSGYKAKRKLVR
jgi:hypothetical protein